MPRKKTVDAAAPIIEDTKRLSEPPTDEQVKSVREAQERRNNERLERMNAIADNADEASKADFKETDGDTIVIDEAERKEAEAVKEDEETKEALEKGIETKEEAEEEQKDASDVKVINGETHYLTIVNGREKWLTLHQLRATAQKVESADEYLQTASEAVKNASRLAPSQDESSKVEEDDLERTLSSAVMGDEGAIKKLASALKARPSAVTPDVLQQIDERLSFRQAVDWFNDEYSDVMSDPYLKRLVVEKDTELAQTTQLSYRQRLKAAGDEIRTWKQKISGVTVKPSNDKLARKQTLVNAPSAAGKQVERADEQEEESVESVIDKMAQKRGQPHAIHHAKH
jgi:hypothetical protein